MEQRRTDRKALLEQSLTAMGYLFANNSTSDNRQWVVSRDTHLPILVSVNGTKVPSRSEKLTFRKAVMYRGGRVVISDPLNRAQRGVLRYLEGAESREGDVWYSQDYRLAQLVVTLSDEGKGNPYSKAFRQLFGRDAHEVRFWWRDRQKLYRLCEIGGSATPLLHANLAKELGPALIPDYDYSQVSPVPSLPQANPAKKPAAPATAGSGDGGAGSPEKRTA